MKPGALIGAEDVVISITLHGHPSASRLDAHGSAEARREVVAVVFSPRKQDLIGGIHNRRVVIRLSRSLIRARGAYPGIRGGGAGVLQISRMVSRTAVIAGSFARLSM